jgi:hypothetical protein
MNNYDRLIIELAKRLTSAISHNNAVSVKELLDTVTANSCGLRDLMMHQDDFRGCLLDTVAAKSGFVLRDLLMHQDWFGRSVLYIAVVEGNLEVVNALLKSAEKEGVVLDLVLLPDKIGGSCLWEFLNTRDPHNPLHKNDLDVMQALLDVGGKPLVMMMTRSGNNCLHRAMRLRNLEIVNLLLRFGGGELAENKNIHGISPLKIALQQKRQYGNSEIVDTLLDDIGRGSTI